MPCVQALFCRDDRAAGKLAWLNLFPTATSSETAFPSHPCRKSRQMAPLLAAVELSLDLPQAVLAAPLAAGSPHDPPTPHVVATPLGAAGPIIEAAAESPACAAAAPSARALPPLVGNHPPKRPWRKEEDALLLRLARAAPPPLACALSRAVPTRSLPRSASPTYLPHADPSPFACPVPRPPAWPSLARAARRSHSTARAPGLASQRRCRGGLASSAASGGTTTSPPT